MDKYRQIKKDWQNNHHKIYLAYLHLWMARRKIKNLEKMLIEYDNYLSDPRMRYLQAHPEFVQLQKKVRKIARNYLDSGSDLVQR